MSYKIVVDSYCDLPAKYREDLRFQVIPLILQIDDYTIIDDETFDQADYLAKVAASENCARTACPSPELYMEAYNCDADDVYVVTLTSKLSGSITAPFLERICITRNTVRKTFT